MRAAQVLLVAIMQLSGSAPSLDALQEFDSSLCGRVQTPNTCCWNRTIAGWRSLPPPEVLHFLESSLKIDAGRSRTALGCGNPIELGTPIFGVLTNPYAFGVGEPVTYVQAPKLKVTGAVFYRLSNSPTWGLGQFAGANRRRFLPELLLAA